MSERYEEIDELLDQFTPGNDSQSTPLPEGEDDDDAYTTPPNRPQLHIYVMDTPLEEQLAALQEKQVAQEPEAAHPSSLASRPHRPWHRRLLPLCLLMLALLGSLGGITYGIITLLTPATATITLVPDVKTVTVTATFTVTDHPQALSQITGRMLPALTLTETGTVPTTGTGHQEATPARGMITFYNALPQAQSIPAGELLTGTDGAQVVTDVAVLLPPADPPTEGVASVAAHTLATGNASNLPARNISAPCCRAYVLAVNLHAFTGGQDARSFPMVTQRDLEQEAVRLRSILTQSSTSALTGQLDAGEALVQPVPCKTAVSSSDQPGEEATQLTVTLTGSCQGEAYEQSGLGERMTHLLTDASSVQPGAGYARSGDIATSILHVELGHILTVRATGAWVYQFSQTQGQALAVKIAGKSKQDALLLLTRTPGIRAASIALSGGNTALPTNAGRIAFIVTGGATR